MEIYFPDAESRGFSGVHLLQFEQCRFGDSNELSLQVVSGGTTSYPYLEFKAYNLNLQYAGHRLISYTCYSDSDHYEKIRKIVREAGETPSADDLTKLVECIFEAMLKSNSPNAFMKSLVSLFQSMYTNGKRDGQHELQADFRRLLDI